MVKHFNGKLLDPNQLVHLGEEETKEDEHCEQCEGRRGLTLYIGSAVLIYSAYLTI